MAKLLFGGRKFKNYRALADIQESIEELRYYREAIFVPTPGVRSLILTIGTEAGNQEKDQPNNKPSLSHSLSYSE